MILNFLNLVEDEQTQFLVEAVEHHHLVERGVRLVAVLLLGHLQKRIHIGRQTVLPYEFEVSLSLRSVGYRQRVMGTGTLVHSLGSMNLSPMIPYLIFNKDSIFKSNSSVRLKKGKTSSSDHSKQSS